MPSLADDRDAIRDLYSRYCLYLDTGNAADWARLYAEDGVFVGGGDEVTGHTALEAYADRLNPGSVHRLILNHVVDVDGDTAACRASVVLVAQGAIVSTGRTTDELRRVDGSWRIARRTFVAD